MGIVVGLVVVVVVVDVEGRVGSGVVTSVDIK